MVVELPPRISRSASNNLDTSIRRQEAKVRIFGRYQFCELAAIWPEIPTSIAFAFFSSIARKLSCRIAISSACTSGVITSTDAPGALTATAAPLPGVLNLAGRWARSSSIRKRLSNFLMCPTRIPCQKTGSQSPSRALRKMTSCSSSTACPSAAMH
jgi:hypothetical protein